jgi:hypothetical protein
MSLQVVQVVINDASNKTITGVYDFDRACGGVLIPPSGPAMPVSAYAGEVFFNTTNLALYRRDDNNATWDVLTATTSSLTPVSHELLRQFVHLANDGPYDGFSGCVRDMGPIPFPTSSVWFTDNTRTKKIIETYVIYNSNMTPATTQYKIYDIDGVTALTTMTDTMSYNGVFEISKTRTLS